MGVGFGGKCSVGAFSFIESFSSASTFFAASIDADGAAGACGAAGGGGGVGAGAGFAASFGAAGAAGLATGPDFGAIAVEAVQSVGALKGSKSAIVFLPYAEVVGVFAGCPASAPANPAIELDRASSCDIDVFIKFS